MRTPAEQAERLAADLRRLADRLAAAESGESLFTREDVERIVEGRLAREHRKRREVEAERDELAAELEGLRRDSETPAL